MTNPVQPPAGKAKSKLPMILMIIGGILLLGLCCCGGGMVYSWYKAKQAVASLPGFIQERAAREGVHVDMSGGGVSLPDNFPSDVPQYPGAKITIAITPPAEPEAGSVAFQTSGTIKQLVDFYKKNLSSNGWKAVTQQESVDSAMLSYTKGTRHVMINCAGDKDCSVTVSYSADKTSKSTEGDN